MQNNYTHTAKNADEKEQKVKFTYGASWLLAGLLLVASLMLLARLRNRDDEVDSLES